MNTRAHQQGQHAKAAGEAHKERVRGEGAEEQQAAGEDAASDREPEASWTNATQRHNGGWQGHESDQGASQSWYATHAPSAGRRTGLGIFEALLVLVECSLPLEQRKPLSVLLVRRECGFKRRVGRLELVLEFRHSIGKGLL